MENQKILSKNHNNLGRKYYPTALSNLIHMGHCAPTVMQTLLDISSTRKEWLVRLSAGMPGGIGNTGHECGAVTSPLVVPSEDELPIMVCRGLAGSLPELWQAKKFYY